MTRSDVLAFIRTNRYAVQASTSISSAPQAAVVGIAAADNFELVFDTTASSRKAGNLMANSSVAFVIGGLKEGDERTVQYEGTAEFPTNEELSSVKATYFSAFPDGKNRESSSDTTYIRVLPRWLRYSNFNVEPPEIVEFWF